MMVLIIFLISILSHTYGHSCSSSGGQCPVPLAIPLLCPPRLTSSCRSDLQCPGDQRCCSDGCVHRCLPVCPGTCTDSSVCRLHRRCTLPGCPPPLARCVATDDKKNVKIGCSLIDCPGLCQDTERGPVCQKHGQCPINDIKPLLLNSVASVGLGAELGRKGVGAGSGVFTLGRDTCSNDFMCPRYYKCCSYGLGRKCIPACTERCGSGSICRLKAEPTFCHRPPCFNFRRAVCDKSARTAMIPASPPTKSTHMKISTPSQTPPMSSSQVPSMSSSQVPPMSTSQAPSMSSSPALSMSTSQAPSMSSSPALSMSSSSDMQEVTTAVSSFSSTIPDLGPESTSASPDSNTASTTSSSAEDDLSGGITEEVVDTTTVSSSSEDSSSNSSASISLDINVSV